MNRTLLARALMAGVLAASAAVAGCTMKSQEAPPLTGPSEFGTSIVVSVTPDTIFQDGASQSLVTITARDPNGNPLRSKSLRAQIYVDGVPTDFGTLSARSVVTGADGRATLVYTAPAAPGGLSVDTNTTVDIVVTPLGDDFNNAVSRLATIRLVPTGVVVPQDGLQPAFTFTPSVPTDHQVVLFDASTSKAPGNNPIASYSWNFGDGSSGSGSSVSHSYNSAGSYVVKLTIADAFNRQASSSQTLNVDGGTEPTVAFTSSPSAPRAGETVNFNASSSRPAPGRIIRSYAWDFGDGDQKTTTGPTTTHDYVRAGSYNVTLVVTDDAGRTAASTGGVTVSADNPTADFTFSPTSPVRGAPVNFNSSGSSAVPGRTITSWFWSFGDGTNGSGSSPSHTYGVAAAYTVTLTVTDSLGKTGTVAKTLTVQ